MTSVISADQTSPEMPDPAPRNTSKDRSELPQKRNKISLKFLDALCWVFAVFVVYLIYNDFVLRPSLGLLLSLLIATTVLSQLIFGWLFSLYRRSFTVGSFDEIRALLKSGVVTGLALVVVSLILGYTIEHPVALNVIIPPIAQMLMFGIRYTQRLKQLARSVPDRRAARTLIIGAGEVGTHLIRQMITTPGTKYWPVGLVDDSSDKANVRLYHLRVLGTVDELPDLIVQAGAKVLVIAVAQPSKQMMRRIQQTADEFDCQVKVIPPLAELLEKGIRSTDLRDMSIHDLLGREPVDTNVEEIAGYLSGSRVMVTGAGGSIGSVLCQQISRFQPAELIMVDRDETGLQQTQLLVNGNGLLASKETVLADIRDADAIRRVFEEYRPNVVFHAAALKHLPMLERFPEEGWKTNVLGTQNVLEAAAAVNVDRFVNISTDKAANPTSQLGYSKRAAERLTAWMSQRTGRRYLSVRFGNVIGSRGSMLPTFTNLIEQGKPLTVTHPEATRYFMTIPEACQLVLQAGGIGQSGEVLILDMGEPVRILDVAKRMIALSGKDIEIEFTGLRAGEKLHEELTSESEDTLPSQHPLISRTSIEPLPLTELQYLNSTTKVHIQS